LLKGRVVRVGKSFANDAHVPSATDRQCHRLRKIVTPVAEVDIRAWTARLRHFQNHLVPDKSISNPHAVLVGARHGQIFAECSGFAMEAFFASPPAPMIG
jgi:hypothetical protein